MISRRLVFAPLANQTSKRMEISAFLLRLLALLELICPLRITLAPLVRQDVQVVLKLLPIQEVATEQVTELAMELVMVLVMEQVTGIKLGQAIILPKIKAMKVPTPTMMTVTRLAVDIALGMAQGIALDMELDQGQTRITVMIPTQSTAHLAHPSTTCSTRLASSIRLARLDSTLTLPSSNARIVTLAAINAPLLLHANSVMLDSY
jgi:hypothetical protein